MPLAGDELIRTRPLTFASKSSSFFVSRLSERSSTMHHSQFVKVWLRRLRPASATHSGLVLWLGVITLIIGASGRTRAACCWKPIRINSKALLAARVDSFKIHYG